MSRGSSEERRRSRQEAVRGPEGQPLGTPAYAAEARGVTGGWDAGPAGEVELEADALPGGVRRTRERDGMHGGGT